MALHEGYNAAEVIGVQWATIWFPKTGNFALPQSLANFDPQKPETYPAAWAPIGLTSAESLPKPTTDGGDAQVLNTAELPSVISIKGVTTTKLEFTVHSLNEKTLQMAWGGGKATSLIEIGTDTLKAKAQELNFNAADMETSAWMIYSGGGKTLSLYFPRISVSSKTFSEISLQGLFAIPFAGTALAPTAEQAKQLKTSASGLVILP